VAQQGSASASADAPCAPSRTYELSNVLGRTAHPRPGADTIEPLTSDARRLHVTVSARFLEKLEAARAALSHSHPAGRAEEVLEAGLDLLLARAAKRTGLARGEERTPPPTRGSAPRASIDIQGDVLFPQGAPSVARREHLPAHLRRAVWERAQGRCQWPLESGGTCCSTLRLEVDHVEPRARGGPTVLANLRLLCAAHNQESARRVFGREWMSRFPRRPGGDLAAGARSS
jgi:hypothetical protein